MHEEFFKLLKKDHAEVMSLLDEMKELSERDFKKREKLFTQMKEELVPHLRAEEKAFYPVLRQNKETKEDALEAMEEHHAAELILLELDKMSKQEEFWSAKLSVFSEMISHHIEEEEGKISQDAQKSVSEDTMQTVMDNFQKEKERVKEQSATRSQSR